VCIAEIFSKFNAPVMFFSHVKGLPALNAYGEMPLGLMWQKACALQAIFPTILICERIPWHVGSAVMNTGSPVLIPFEVFPPTVLLLVLGDAYTEPELSATCPTRVHFVLRMLSLLFSQHQNVFHDWATRPTRVCLLGGWTGLWSPNP
jgi:hypothetical protein